MNLTDTQLIILSKASQRDDGAVELPRNLKGGAAHRVVGSFWRAACWKSCRPAGRFPLGGATMKTGRSPCALPSAA
jgi:hypothetical protein